MDNKPTGVLSPEPFVDGLLVPQNGNGLQTKDFDPKVIQGSIVDSPDIMENRYPGTPFLFQFASLIDEIIPWGYNVGARDAQLREFVVSEPLLNSAVYSASIRNASFEWEIINTNPAIDPYVRTIEAVTEMLKNSDRGDGWESLILKTSEDIYCQDNASFWEIIRAFDDPSAPVWNIAHLDSARCRRTGDPKEPVIYTDRKGRRHILKYYQVLTLEEYPSPIETLYGVQVCAVSRCLRAAQIIRDIAIYKQEKVSGRFAGAMHVIGGITSTELEDVMRQHRERLDNSGNIRYSSPILFPGIDPTHPVSHVQIDLASLPDNFNEETTLQWYIAQLAMAFGVDYQEFAPLPSKGMGSSAEGEILHMKTRGKGPATIMKQIEFALNNSGILPRSVRFRFQIQDLKAEAERAAARFERGKDRALRLKNGELDPFAAQELAILDGDLPEHIAAGIRERGLPQPVMQPELGGSSFTSQQIESGSESHEERKASDLDRAIALHDLERSGEVSVNIDVEVSEEDIAEQRRQLARKLSG